MNRSVPRLPPASVPLADIAEQAHDALLSIDLDGRVIAWNHGAERIFGHSRAEAEGKLLATLLDDRQKAFPRVLARATRGLPVGPVPLGLPRADGEPVEVSIVCSPVRSPEGAVVAVSIIARERGRSDRLLEDLARVASHDLHEPLRMVTGYTSLLQSRYGGKLDAEADEFIAFVAEGAQRMERLLAELTAFAQVRSRMSAFVPCDTGACLARALDRLGGELDEAAVRVEAEGLPVVEADPDLITLLFQRLVTNAIRSRAGEPSVRVRATREEDTWRFTVEDNGEGIAPERHARVFRLFERHPPGLALCAEIVEQHGSRLELDSAPGRGTRFRFALPAVEPAQEREPHEG